MLRIAHSSTPPRLMKLHIHRHLLIAVFAALLFFVSTASAQTVAASQQQAIKKYPELSVAGSALNKAFVAEVARRKQTNPGFFRFPDWPMRLADELTSSPTPAATPPPPAETLPPVVVVKGSPEALAAKVQDSKTLRKVLYEAIDRKRTKVKLPPGTYRMEADPRNPGDAHLALRDVQKLEIDGTGVTLLIGDFVNLPGISLYGCKDVTLKGITIDAATPVLSQGKVTKIAEDHSFYELEMDPAYLLDLALVREKGRPASVFDPQARTWKVGVPDFFIKELEEIAPRNWRLHLKGHVQARPVQPGDPVAIPLFGLPAVTARHSENLTYDGVTVYAAGAMAFHEDNGEGNTRIVNCTVTRKPGTDRLLSTNADGFWSGSMRKGPTVLNSSFQFMHDDGFNVHGKVAKILAVDGKRVDLDSAAKKSFRRNDTALFLDGTTGSVIGERTVTDSDGTDEAPQIKVSDPAGLKPGCLVVNLNQCGREFRVRGLSLRPDPGQRFAAAELEWSGAQQPHRVHREQRNPTRLGQDGRSVPKTHRDQRQHDSSHRRPAICQPE